MCASVQSEQTLREYRDPGTAGDAGSLPGDLNAAPVVSTSRRLANGYPPGGSSRGVTPDRLVVHRLDLLAVVVEHERAIVFEHQFVGP